MLAGLSVAVIGASSAAEPDTDTYDLGGFDDDDSDSDDLDGFDDDDLGGFDDDVSEDPEPERPFAPKRFWELTGSTSLGASINYLDHDSDTGTRYEGLQRLRTRLNLQLDLDLPAGWRGRLAGFGFYDWAYLANGRHSYTRDVLDDYEWEVDFQEVWVQGSVAKSLDLKVGRQIVNWGRSDTLRVLDVLNPLDNREPGLTDIEDLRRPVMMVKADAYFGDWSLSLIAIPEMRFSKNPPAGSDFAPVLASIGELASFIVDERFPNESFNNTSWAARLGGVFSGWDISFHFARRWEDAGYLRPILSSSVPVPGGGTTPILGPGTELRHSRVTLAGAGANYTIGSWLFKTELAWIDGLDYTTSSLTTIDPDGDMGPIAPITVQLPTGSVRKSRLDFMIGVEYYGLADTNIVVEVANRHIFGFREDMRPNFTIERNTLETAVRITREFMNERLSATLVAVVFGNHAQDGSVVRLDLRYDLKDSLVLGGGILLFQDGDRIPFDTIHRNDRLFLELKYSF